MVFTFSSCEKDFEKINNDPHGFTTASDGALFNSVISSLTLGWNEQFYLHNEIFYKQTQLAALSKNAWGNFTIGTEEIWADYYKPLANIRELERRWSNIENIPEINNMKAILKISLAYKTFKLTDLFGDIPFFDAGKGYESLDFLRVPFDSQRDIYLFLLDELKWAEENIDISATNDPFKTFVHFDNLFNGKLEMWRKFANSLRLKHAMRMADKEQVLAGDIINDIISNDLPLIKGFDFITYLGESVMILPSKHGFKNQSKYWSFNEHKNLRMGSNIWNQMSENDNADGSGIFDIRAYYFFETNNNGEWKPFPQISSINTPAIGGIPYSNHRDNAYNIKGATCIYSPFNYFLIRDEDKIPEIMLTGAEVHFILAEAYLRGIGVGKNESQASIEYLQGIESSLKFWGDIMENSVLPLNQNASFADFISIPSNLSLSYLVERTGFWNVNSDEEKLKLIYSQRWIDNFRQSWDAFALNRRTGNTPREGDQLDYFSLQIPPSEIEYNTENWQNTYGDKGPNPKVWWMK